MRSETQRRLSQHRNGREPFNVMVVGPRGVGKSTFLQTLCDSFEEMSLRYMTENDYVVYPRDDEDDDCGSGGGSIGSGGGSSGNSLAIEEPDPFYLFEALAGTETFCSIHVDMLSPSRKQPLSVELIDTPGIDGTDEGRTRRTIDEIAWEIKRRYRATVDEETQVHRDCNSSRAAHIHAVIYMVPPPVYWSADTDAFTHRPEISAEILSPADAEAIRTLTPLCNVIVAVGKCDTIENADRAVLKDGRFFRDFHKLRRSERLYDFCDAEGTQPDPFEQVKALSRLIVREMPFLLCGSKHVDEWQAMRLVEEKERRRAGGTGSLADWRTLRTRHNRPRGSTVIAGGTARAHFWGGSRSGASLDNVAIRRMQQSRVVSLVRDFPWGQLQLNNKRHCSFALLVDLVFDSFRTSLVHRTNEHYYEAYRAQCLAAEPRCSGIKRDMSAYMEAHQREPPPVVPHGGPAERPVSPGAHPDVAHRSSGGTVPKIPAPRVQRPPAARAPAPEPVYAAA
ncbi:Cell division control protein 3, partial [Coemansia nantahalensis]